MREKKEINIAVGNHIQLVREEAGYTQDTLSELLDITPNHLSAIERGVSGISLETLQRLCLLLGVSADRILFGLDAQEQEALAIARRITDPRPALDHPRYAMTAKKVPRPVYFPVAENLTKKDFPVTINVKKGRCDKRFSPKWCYWTYHLCQQNRHLAEWRFCFFILIVTVSPKTCNVKIIGIGVTSFRREWPNRLPYDHSALSCPGNRADLF